MILTTFGNHMRTIIQGGILVRLTSKHDNYEWT